ncbi:transaminase [Prosthecomicrobium hirschii]|uniref:transaminase n=1 Tax=Prosthecodimorpha hirschii TaxID=665126 RepID=UPI00221F3ADE|nr:transaminase [Prosthecomicrobium hirschii]MCW1839517.1 transaminase [Prosthecomicrobium hirschii]
MTDPVTTDPATTDPIPAEPSNAARLDPIRRHGVDPDRLAAFLAAEQQAYRQAHPRSADLASRSSEHWHGGVPLHWMSDWGLPFPLFLREATGSCLTCVDGHEHADFCLGDTGAMFGHAPEPVRRAVAHQIARGATAMLPSALVPEVGRLLAERFGLPVWQATLTASDANRAVIRWARALTGRRDILIFNGAYHGAVDDVHVRLADGAPIQRAGLVGQVYDMRAHTRVVEFNDIAALEAALADRGVALVLAEPVMTNIGMVLPDEGYHAALRRLTRAAGTLLAIDETHTLSAGPGGYARAHALEPDFLVVGKAIGGGVPAAVYGVTAAVSQGMARVRAEAPGYSGIGTTLSANALAMAAMRAMFEEVMTADAYRHMIATASDLAGRLRAIIADRRLPWCVTAAGARVEFMLAPEPPRTGGAAARIGSAEIEGALRLALINRGVVVTPFHNMLLAAPTTGPEEVDRLCAGLEAALDAIVAA